MWASGSLQGSAVSKIRFGGAGYVPKSWRWIQLHPAASCFFSSSGSDGPQRRPPGSSSGKNRTPSHGTNATRKAVVTRPDNDRTRPKGSSGTPQQRAADAMSKGFQQGQQSRAPEGRTTHPIPLPTPQAILEALAANLSGLQRQSDRLKPRPPVCSSDGFHLEDDPDATTRQDIFGQAQTWLNQLDQCVEKDLLDPSKHRAEFSILLERVLQLYSDTVATPADFADCNRVLELLSSWRLDVQQSHVDHFVTAAARVQQWKAAAGLFERYIDPDAGGRPCDVSVSNPVGLYVVAKHAQEESAAATTGGTAAAASSGAVDRVMEAVLSMSMVSSTDQNTYVLAAGTALGRAGEWEPFIDFLHESENVERLGQALIAAVMQACLLCDQPDQALRVHDEYLEGKDAEAADEWHWGGGENVRLRPLFRDLTMQALGGSQQTGLSERALEYYWASQTGEVTVSVEALCGVVQACRRDGNWEDAMSILFSVLTKAFASCWLVPGHEFSVNAVDTSVPFRSEVLQQMGKFLVGVMTACNEGGQFGAAILSLRLLNLSMQGLETDYQGGRINSGDHDGSSLELAVSLSNMIAEFNEQDAVLETVMVSLAGLNCHTECFALFKLVTSGEVDNGRFPLAQVTYDAVLSDSQRYPSFFHSVWPSLLRQMMHFTNVFHSVYEDNGKTAEKNGLGSWLSNIIEACSKATQPQTGITLATWVELHSGENEQVVPTSDALAASLINAHCEAGQFQDAMDVFSSIGPSSGLLSSTAAIKTLFRCKRDEDAMRLFQDVLKTRASPDLMSAAAEGLVAAGEWESAIGIYRLALSSGCLSEELGILALKSISEAKVDRRFRVMRNVVDDVANLVGIKPSTWLELKYWDLKRLLGFSFVGRLMWWDDPNTRDFNELNLALQSLETRRVAGLAPKNDALRLIVSAARSFDKLNAIDATSTLLHIPRDKSSWMRTLRAVVYEAERSTLFHDADFLEEVSLAFAEVGCTEEAVSLLEDAHRRGLSIQESTIARISAFPIAANAAT